MPSDSVTRDTHIHLFAYVLWPQFHPQRQEIGKPVEIWCKDLFESSNTNNLLPVENIVSRLIIANM